MQACWKQGKISGLQRFTQHASNAPVRLVMPRVQRKRAVTAIASWKRRKFSQHLLCRVFDGLGITMNDKKPWTLITDSVTTGLWLHESVRSIDDSSSQC